MATQRISRTEYRVPGGSGLPRVGGSSHAESAEDVDGYLRPLEQVHASAHGYGVLEGLTVDATRGAMTVRIGPGVAVDSGGRHIALAPGGLAEVAADPSAESRLVQVAADGVALPTSGHSGSRVVSVQWRETFDQDLFASSGQKVFQNDHTPWLRLTPAADADQV